MGKKSAERKDNKEGLHHGTEVVLLYLVCLYRLRRESGPTKPVIKEEGRSQGDTGSSSEGGDASTRTGHSSESGLEMETLHELFLG